MNFKTTPRRYFVLFLVTVLLLAETNASDFETELQVAMAMINPRQFDKATHELHRLEEMASTDREKADVTAALLRLYAKRANDAYNKVYSFVLSRMDTVANVKRIEYAKRLLSCPAATKEQKLAAYADLAHTMSLESQFYELTVNENPDLAKELKKDNLKYLAEYVALDPENTQAYLLMGDAYLAENNLPQAENAYSKALTSKGTVPWMKRGAAQLGLASVALARNEKALALKLCKEIVTNKSFNAIRNTAGSTPGLKARELIEALEPYDLDTLKLPYYTGAKVFPTAQKAEYTDHFKALSRVKLVTGKQIKSDDPRIGLLRTKFTRFGIEFDDKAPYEIRVSCDGKGKPQGYVLEVTDEAATVRGNDLQGTLWGIVSLIQLLDQQKNALRICTIEDWPDCPVRGFNGDYFYGNLEFMLFNKLNAVNSHAPALDDNVWTERDRFITQQYVRNFARFGLDVAIGAKRITMVPMRPLTNEKTFEQHMDFYGMVAEAGGNALFLFDDIRYPAHPSDIEKAGTTANLDAKYLTRLYRALKNKYPNVKFIFCPPFYWGPDGPASKYPEPREPYLRSLGKELDPEIHVFWTGPRVKGYEKTSEQVAWITDLIKRKPLIWQNAPGPRTTYLSYITDDIRLWTRCHYDDFLDDTDGIFANGGVERIATVIATMADWTWNTKAYDPNRSVREAVAQLYGKDMFEILENGAGNLAVLDEFWGKVTPAFVSDLDRYKKCVERAEQAFAKAQAYNQLAMEQYSDGYQFGLKVARSMIASAEKNPDFHAQYKDHIAITEQLAKDETKADVSRGDIIITPIDMHGGKVMSAKKKPSPTQRFYTILYGRDSATPGTSFKFECDPFPPEGPYELYLCGRDDEDDGNCNLLITLNEKVVFDGPGCFETEGWTIQKLDLPFDTLKRYNELVIKNNSPGETVSGPPYILLNYAVMKSVIEK